eukprot:TRINITY_DN7155_c0_g1_i1.p1 TRINITY_DN7155_c0_g1~~TRINITY_DN7155_c0_g1_i1.p1  ORF type:complete len:207 (+),score=17.79 TRINITY_DN7155_c0_g1_i1:275-895(+)
MHVSLDCERHDREGLSSLLDVASIAVCTTEFVLYRAAALHGMEVPLGSALPVVLLAANHPRLQTIIVTLGSQGGLLCQRTPDASGLAAWAGDMDALAAGCPVRIADGWRGVRFLAAPVPEGTAVVDTVGAGDAFQAGLAHAVIRGVPLAAAVEVASRVALTTCLQKGSRGYPAPDVVDKWCSERTSQGPAVPPEAVEIPSRQAKWT